MKIMTALFLTLAICLCSSAFSLEVIAGAGAAGSAVPIAGGVALVGYGAYKLVTWIIDPSRILTFAGKEATVLALQEVSSLSSPADAMATAADVNKACVVILAWLPMNAAQSADAINQFVTAQFGNDPIVLDLLQKIEPTVQRYIPIASAFLSANELKYLTALIVGIQQGALAYSQNPAMTIKHKYTTAKQNEHEHKKMKVQSTPEHRWFVPVETVSVIDIKPVTAACDKTTWTKTADEEKK